MSKINNLNEDITYPVGTKVYAAPEILFNNIFTRTSDIWSLGILIFMLVKDYRLNSGYRKGYRVKL